MSTRFRHFAIHADDVPRARRFYEQALGLTFTPWGPPDFYQIHNVGTGLQGALQARHEVVPGRRATSFEATLGVDDLKAAISAILAAGGQIVMPPFRIPGVGEVAYFEDTEGNVCGVMQYEPGVWET